MSLTKVLTSPLVKIGVFWQRLKPQIEAKMSFWTGLRARLDAWRERRRELQGDISHTFQALDYPGSRKRHYLVHVPHGKSGRGPRPLVLVLHGCRQDNRDIRQISGFNQLADQHGFLVAYPFITSYRGLRFKNCWGWWFDREIHAGTGEVEDLWQIVEEIKLHYPVDDRRIHVTGLSSGAGMVVAMMVAHAGKIASGASVAGVPYSEKPAAVQNSLNRTARHKSIRTVVSKMRAEMGGVSDLVPLQIVHSKNDQTVDIQSAKNLRDSWGRCFGIDTQDADKIESGQVKGTGWEHRQYRKGGENSLVETLFLEGPGHGWYGGDSGEFSYPDAPDISSHIWEFFDSHPL